MASILNIFSRRARMAVPQSQPIPGTVANSAGGHAFAVDGWTRPDRFLVLGTEGGSYYAGAPVLTRDNAHPVQALRMYRERTGIAAKLVVGMVPNGFSIADPDDAGMPDVVGFDTATPAAIADFLRQG